MAALKWCITSWNSAGSWILLLGQAFKCWRSGCNISAKGWEKNTDRINAKSDFNLHLIVWELYYLTKSQQIMTHHMFLSVNHQLRLRKNCRDSLEKCALCSTRLPALCSQEWMIKLVLSMSLSLTCLVWSFYVFSVDIGATDGVIIFYKLVDSHVVRQSWS